MTQAAIGLSLHKRAAAAVLAGALFLAAGALVVVAPIFGLAIAAAPAALVLASGLVSWTSHHHRRRDAAAAGALLGVASSFVGAAGFTAVSIGLSSDPVARSTTATILILALSTVSLGIFYLVPSMAIGFLWALICRYAFR